MVWIFAIGIFCVIVGVLRSRWIMLAFRLQQVEERLSKLETGIATGGSATPGARDATPAAESPPDAPQASPATPPPDEDMPVVPPPVPPQASPAEAPAPSAPTRSLEEIVGTRWSVWVGGVALGLGALLLVRYSIESGLFGPGFRVLAGLALAGGLAAAGEWLRRRQGPVPVLMPGASAPAYVPGVLTGAGAVAAFGALYAAHALYGFIGPGPAMLALGATGIACLYAAALHGPVLAGLGLLASFATPVLVSSAEPNPWALTIYLGVIGVANYAFARLRRWLWLALATAAAGGLWAAGFAFLSDDDLAYFAPGVTHLVLFSALAAFVIGIAPYRDQGETAPLDRASHSVLTIHVLIGLGLFAGGTQLENIGWLNSVLSLVLVYAAAGLVAASMRGALALAGALIVGALWVWPGFPLAPGSTVTHLPAGAWRSLAEAGLFLSFAALAPLSLASVCTRQLFKGPALTRAGLWIMAGTATLTPLAALTSAYLRAGAAISGMGFAAVAAALACLFVAAATAARADIDKPLEAAGRNARLFILGAAASASLAALALAFTFALEGGTLTVALALSALGAAFVSVRLDIPALRWCVAALGLTVAARLAWDPRIVGDALGTTPVFNWLLFGYGVPALAFGFAARLMRRGGPEDTPVRIAEALGVLLAGFLVFFEIRHAMNGGDIYARRHSMVEQGLHALSAFGFAAVLTRLDHARANRVFHMASLAFAVISFAITVVGLGITANPLLTHEAVGGGALVNSLLLGYALPAIAALILARTAQGLRPRWYVSGARIAAIALTFAFLSLEVRRFWLGEKINVLLGMGQSELYSYSAVWLAFGGLLLVYGLWRSSREVRLASAGFVVLTVLKVFLIDLSSLEGLLRAVSFIALGLALIAIGLAYQRFVFGGGRKDPQGVRAPGDMV